MKCSITLTFIVTLCTFFTINDSKRSGRHSSSSSSSDSNNAPATTTQTSITSDDIIEIIVEDGTCGFGEQYSYFIRPGNNEYVLFVFGGFGFCYDESSCTSADTIIDSDSTKFLLTSDSPWSISSSKPFSNFDNTDKNAIIWTIIYLPQCTEDFHIGYSTIPLGTTITEFNFQGARNIELILDTIFDNNEKYEIQDYVNFNNIKHMTISGFSSGSLGAMMWSNTIFEFLSDDALKTVIIDCWTINPTLYELFAPILLSLLDLTNSPAINDDLLPYVISLDTSMGTLLNVNQNKFCDLFVSFIFFEYDTDQNEIHAALLQDSLYLDFDFWTNQFNNDVLPLLIGDDKRTSHYVTQGNGHVLFFENFSNLTTKCEEAPTFEEYFSDVIGDAEIVEKYYGKPTYRIKDFPQYSWNNIIIECLCDT